MQSTSTTATRPTAAHHSSGCGMQPAKTDQVEGGGTAAPQSSSATDAIVAALSKVVSQLSALIDALRGAQSTSAPGAVTGNDPGPTAKQGASSCASPAPTPLTAASTVTGGGPPPALRVADAGYGGPYMSTGAVGAGYATNFTTGSAHAVHSVLHFFGRNDATSANRVYLFRGDKGSVTVAFPDTGSVTLSSGTTFSWSPRATGGSYSGPGNDPQYSISRPGTQPISFGGKALDLSPTPDAHFVSVLTDAETIELADIMATRYPVASN